MRYFVNWKVLPVPREMIRTALALLEETERWAEKEKKAGRLVELGTNTAGGGGIAVWEVDSNDTLFKKLMECPFSPFLDYTVTPLTDFKLSMRINKDAFKEMLRQQQP